ncbi:hypothetical protein G5I_10827 [Acromyrmex echinatior]|uniref:Uncharacterized protein n=1 Tax=Acromyrmex echinatior TaxID=103372 RepID=F4WXX3_ACREC|nr:hypothetical protein G5I_10827 [Acromyrmex echinatior]
MLQKRPAVSGFSGRSQRDEKEGVGAIFDVAGGKRVFKIQRDIRTGTKCCGVN